MGSLADLWKECVKTPNDSSAWERLLDSHHALMAAIVVRVARRFGISRPQDMDDAIQEICLKLSVQAREGRLTDIDDSILDAYLKTSIANAAHDYFRGRRARRRDDLAATSIDDPVNSALQLVGTTDLEREVLIREIENMVQANPRDRDVFLMYYRQGWTAREISTIPSLGLTPKGVESLCLRLINMVRERVKDLPQGGKGFSESNA